MEVAQQQRRCYLSAFLVAAAIMAVASVTYKYGIMPQLPCYAGRQTVQGTKSWWIWIAIMLMVIITVLAFAVYPSPKSPLLSLLYGTLFGLLLCGLFWAMVQMMIGVSVYSQKASVAKFAFWSLIIGLMTVAATYASYNWIIIKRDQ